MANVFGRLNSSSLATKVDPYAIETSSTTQISYSSDEVPQNQTRDITKILKKKLPGETGNDELVFPFDSTLFTEPLDYVAEAALPSSLGTASAKAVVLGDTKALQSEGTTDVDASTFTINHTIPAGAVSETTYTINVLKYTPGGTQQRLFSWGSMDTPAMVCVKWKAAMDPSVSYASGAPQSYGHAALSYDTPSGKFFGTFLESTEWGTYVSGGSSIYYEIDRFYGNSASKTTLGLRPIIDNTKRITIDIAATGSQGATVRQVKYDITRILDEQNSLLDFFDPLRKYTLLIANSIVLFDFLLFAGDTEIVRNPEGSSPVTFYTKIYKPVLRICGGTIANGAYTGVVSPVSRLTVLSDDSRALSLSDFINKRLPTTIGHDSFFSGDIIGRASNGDPFNVIDTLEALAGKEVEILSCTPTLDSWLVTTDNAKGSVQYHVTPAYSPEDVEAFTKDSPSTFQNNSAYAANAAFDKRSDTVWASADSTFNSSGVGSQFLTIEYPRTYKLSALRFVGSSRYSGATAPTAWVLSGSNDNTTFIDIQSDFHKGYCRQWRYLRAHVLSAQPVSTNSFKIIVGSADGRVMSMIDSPMPWNFFLTIIKSECIVNSGLYTLSSSGFTKTS
ncbi:hypothetical protein T492DRAFT_834580 [Pavlovales sp. CCMP2436]|nr:hypothetical protein T492DRAFT_834580 [Pavlovales sp. CCMP2436]